MAIKWVALFCLLVSIAVLVAQAEDAVSIATDDGIQDPAANSQENATLASGASTQGPIAEIVFAGGECTLKCTLLLGNLNEVADPKNIEMVIRDLDSLCERYQNAVQCAASCSAEEKAKFDQATALLQYTCVEKREMLQQLGSCMTQHQDSSITTCEQQCGSLDDLVKADNSTTPADPQQIFAKMGPVCNGLKCTIKCMKKDMNQKCPGAGDFIRDIAVKQVEEAGTQLMKDVNDPTNPIAEHLAKVLKDTLPADCAYMLAPQQFRDAVDGAGNATENSAPEPSGQVDQSIIHPEPEPGATVAHPEPEPETPAHPEPEPGAAAEPSSSNSNNKTEDNRTINKDSVNHVNACGNVIASVLTLFVVFVFAYL